VDRLPGLNDLPRFAALVQKADLTARTEYRNSHSRYDPLEVYKHVSGTSSTQLTFTYLGASC
jgi:hypothetical protein